MRVALVLAALVLLVKDASAYTTSSYASYWRQAHYRYSCGGMIEHLNSYYSSYDRIWYFYCWHSSYSSMAFTNQYYFNSWSNYLATAYGQCNSNGYAAYWSSTQYANSIVSGRSCNWLGRCRNNYAYNDRRWEIGCRRFSVRNMAQSNCGTAYGAWQRVNYLRLSRTAVFKGMYSVRNNNYRDRYWYFNWCYTSCNSNSYYWYMRCEGCSTGYYRSGIGQAQCVPGYYCPGSCRLYSCSPGYYSYQYGRTYCYSCSPGSYQDQYTQRGCKSCGRGTYQNQYAQGGCKGCPSSQYQPYSGRSSCYTKSTCGYGTYMTTDGNSYTNRGCAWCPSGTYNNWRYNYYLSQGPCRTKRTCYAGTYRYSEGTTSTDRVCYGCQSGKYTTGNNANSCSTWSSCSAGTYITFWGSTSANRQCGGCQAGKYSSSSNWGSCQTWASCSAGTYVTQSPTASSNRGCSTCPGGKYSNQVNVGSCTTYSNCAAGKYMSFVGSTIGNRQCSDCATNTYSTQTNTPRSSSTGSCPNRKRTCLPGSYETVNGDTTANRQCGNCAVNTYTDASNLLSCKAHTDCNVGQYQSQAPTSSSNRGCSNCPTNTYMPYKSTPAQQYTSCFPHAGPCPAGSHQSAAPTTTSNRVCRPCATGFTSATNVASSCTAFATCAAGKYAVANSATPTSNRQCRSCPTGTFQASDGYTGTSCRRWRMCGPGERQTAAPTASSDRVCGACPAGQYQDAESHSETSCVPHNTCGAGQRTLTAPSAASPRLCTNCEPGKFQGSGSFTGGSCSACPARQYQDLWGRSGCKSCEAGYHVVSATEQQPCPRGHMCNGCAAEQCPAGAYQNELGQTRCKRCPNNQFQPATGQVGCRTCDAGSYRSDDGEGQVTCPAGSYCPGDCQIMACPAGTYSEGGATRCTPCGETEYQPQPGRSACLPVAPGNFRVSAEEQQECPPGTKCVNAAKVPCVAGQTVAEKAGQQTCVPIKTCGAGQLVQFAATAQSDTACAACPEGWFMDESNHLHPQCKRPKACAAGEYVLVEATATADTVCAACNGRTQFQDDAGQPACKTVSTCPAGHYERMAPTPTSDRMCEPCQLGATYQPNAGNTATACLPISGPCPKGTFESAAATTTSDRVCSTCPAGTWQDLVGQTACKAHTQPCTKPTFEDVAPDSSTDRVCRMPSTGRCPAGTFIGERIRGQKLFNCTECDAGMYSDVFNSAGCKYCPKGFVAPEPGTPNCVMCGVGYYSSVEGGTECSPIEPGYYGTGGSPRARTGVAACDAGFKCRGGLHRPEKCNGYDEYQDEKRQAECKRAPLCRRGKFETVRPTASSGRKCSFCPAESYMPKHDHTHVVCMRATQCKPGEYEVTAPTTSTDRVCGRCDGRTGYTDMANLPACKPLTVCGAGERVAAHPTPSSDRTCKACPAQTFAAGDNDEHCTAARHCPAGMFVSAAPTNSTDRQCAPCTLGATYTDASNQARCMPVGTCGRGQRELAAPTRSSPRECGPCAAGTYMDADGHAEAACKPHTMCRAGTRTHTEGTAVADTACVACDAQSYQDLALFATCRAPLTCAAGEYLSAAHSRSAARVCASCALGATYQDATGHTQTSCKAVTTCPRGTFTAEPATLVRDTVCAPCPAGTYQDEAGQSGCKPVTPCRDAFYISRRATPTADQACAACATLASCASTGEYLKGQCGGATGEAQPACDKCHSSCLTCTGPGTDECLACPTGLRLQGGRCLPECPARMYPSAAGVCQRCDSSCYTCTGGNANQCSSCTGTAGLYASTCRACPGGHWMRRATNDNVCVKCTTCQSGYYAQTACSANADTVCRAWATCPAGTEVASAPSATANRGCRPCVAGSTYADEENSEGCRPVTQCTGTQTELTAPTPSTDRVCQCNAAACNARVMAMYQTHMCRNPTGAELAAGRTACCSGAAEHEMKEALVRSDAYRARHSCEGCTATCDCRAGYAPRTVPGGNVCAPCTQAVDYTSLGGQASCMAASQCAVGEEMVQEATPSADRQCEECMRGYADLDRDGSTSCDMCGPETFAARRGQTTCGPATVCPAGEEEASQPNPSTDRTCHSCLLGETYKGDAGNGRCMPVRQCLFPDAEWMSAAPTLTTDAECSDVTRCAAEAEYQEAPAALERDTVCMNVTECVVPGLEWVLEQATRTSDRQCEALTVCRAGKEYELHAPTESSDRVCVPYTRCADNQYAIVAATPYSDRVCVDVWSTALYAPLPLLNATLNGPLVWYKDDGIPYDPCAGSGSGSGSGAAGSGSGCSGSGSGSGSGDGDGDADVVDAGSGGDGKEARLRRGNPEGQATWAMVHDAAMVQIEDTLAELGMDGDGMVIEIDIYLVDANGKRIPEYNIGEEVLTGSIAIELIFGEPDALTAFMEAVVNGLPGAGGDEGDWPLQIEPCNVEEYLSGPVVVYNNGTIVMPCVPRTQCELDETWAAERGGRTTDRVCLDVSSCSDGVSRPATLTSDRGCSSASTAAMVAGAGAGAALFVLVVLVVLFVLARRRREARDEDKEIDMSASASVKKKAKQSKHEKMHNAIFGGDMGGVQTSFVNPSFSPDGGRAGVENPMYDNGTAVMAGARGSGITGNENRAMFNPLYDEATDVMKPQEDEEGLYDEVAVQETAVGAFRDDDDEGGYLDTAGVDDVDQTNVGGSGYLDVPKDAEEEDGGGYLDVNPDDDDAEAEAMYATADDAGYMDTPAEPTAGVPGQAIYDAPDAIDDDLEDE